MAIYSLRVQTIGRAAGRSVVAAAAYRSGTSLADARLGQDFDFRGKQPSVAYTAILAPEDTPPEWLDRETLWNAAERADKRKDAVPAQEILVALPHELSHGDRRELVRDFARESLVKRGMIADVAIHLPGKDGDERNHHAHILVTTREVGPGGFGPKNPDWNARSFVSEVRREWAEIANRHLERLAPHVAKISEKTLAEQGLERDPTEHNGPEVTAMERRGERTDRGENNRDIQAENIGRQREAAALDKSVADAFDARTWAERPTENIIRDMEATRAGLMRQRDAWRREQSAIEIPRPISVRALEGRLTHEEATQLRRAQEREATAKERAQARGVSLRQIAHWQTNPARAAMQLALRVNRDLDRILRAQAETARAKRALDERRAWTKSPAGRAEIDNLRRPALEAQKLAESQRRTLERKLRRLEKRIDEADRAILDTKAAKRLGHERLRVPTDVPKAAGEGTANARRYFRFMATEPRVALAAAPAPERDAALKFVKALAPGAPVPSLSKAAPSLGPSVSPTRSGPSKGPDLLDS